MTWGGKQGFQNPIAPDTFIVDGWGSALGSVHSERGLTYYEVVQTGHMVPQFSPWVRLQLMVIEWRCLTNFGCLQSAYQSVQYLLGQRAKP